ncbi:uncharacterized protein N7529_009673 [Penicillium soppii]|uniref:uncharacterized protein n=1 Tax=Penicillium soppii TaxID=69789 RepID=UPI002546F989|nr:uncharacterized protein N7529_009673 [Penicillium soppii]KAJ5855729.1 hypothetical protein N7529_009673 [Penicillium soppii]
MSRSRQPASNSLRTTTESREQSVPFPATLRLRAEEAPAAEETSSSRRIRWSEDVVDNEGMGKKSSKVCCIYHKARPVGESSSEESSSSSSSESESEDDRRLARMNRTRRAPSHGDSHNRVHEHEHEHEHDTKCSDHEHDHGSKLKKARRKPSPNAYERMPKPSKNHNPARGS